jgi:hypothetical protein
MDRCLKDKAHFIIAQTIWNNKNGKAVFAEQVFDRCQRKFQDEINRELYKLIEEGGGGGTGKDGKTPVLKAGNVTSLPYGSEPTFKLVYEGDNTEGLAMLHLLNIQVRFQLLVVAVELLNLKVMKTFLRE